MEGGGRIAHGDGSFHLAPQRFVRADAVEIGRAVGRRKRQCGFGKFVDLTCAVGYRLGVHQGKNYKGLWVSASRLMPPAAALALLSAFISPAARIAKRRTRQQG